VRRTPMKRGAGPQRRVRLRAVGQRGLKLKDLDELLHDAVVKRDAYRCMRCTRCREQVVLQAAHIYGKRAHPRMRYYLPNVITLCKGCHFRWWHRVGFGREAAPNNEVREWCLKVLGTEWMSDLDTRAGEPSQGRPKRDMKKIEAELRAAG